MSDNDIIRGIRDNDHLAWRELYFSSVGGIRPRISPLLARVRHVTFDDIFEEAMIVLMENVKDGRFAEGDGVNLSGYLYTICWRKASRLARQAAPDAPATPEGSVEPDGESLLEQDGDEQEALAFLEKVLGSIPRDCQRLLRFFYWDKMPLAEIAPALGLRNEGVAKVKKHRCMEKFKDIAAKMLEGDEAAEEAVRRVIQRDALRGLLEDFRREEEGTVAVAALRRKDKPDD